MSIAALRKIRLEFDKFVLLDDLDLEIAPGERVALVGANGSGKTTIFRILTEEKDPTDGVVFHSKNLRIGYLPQKPRVDGNLTVRQAAQKAFENVRRMQKRMEELSEKMAKVRGEGLKHMMAEYSRLESIHHASGGFSWEHRVEEVLDGVGFPNEDRDKPCKILSGGQHCRLALACVLLSGADLLLLDEPTNHLDLDAIQWLEKFLNRCGASVVLISHDRYMLDRVVSKVYELRSGKLDMYPGNYTNYVKQRKIRRLQLHRQFVKDQEYIQKEEFFIARFHASTSRGKEARGRATRLERRLKAGEFVTEDVLEEKTLSLDLRPEVGCRHPVLVAENLSKSFGPTHIVSELNFKLNPTDKAAILGPNGIGKTTILKMALGQEQPSEGEIKIGHEAITAYFDQQQAQLDDSLTILEQMVKFTGGLVEEQKLRSFLGRFLFTGDEVYKYISTLSGGERSRLLFAGIFWQKPNFLILDEPTNHLDIPSREALEDAICEYEGAVLMVSHDRYFVDKICNRLLALEPQKWEAFEGSYSLWIETKEAQARQHAADQAESTPTVNKTQQRKARQNQRQEKKANSASSGLIAGLNSYQLGKMSADDIEHLIHELECKHGELERSFSEQEVYSNPDKMAQAQQEYKLTEQHIEELMDVWQDKLS